MWYMKVIKRVNGKNSYQKKTFFSISLVFYVYEMMDIW